MKKIKLTLNIEKSGNNENDNWVNYLKSKFDEYRSNKKISNNHFNQILNYLNDMGETNESKHIYNLSIFLKKYIDDSFRKNIQKNSKYIIYL